MSEFNCENKGGIYLEIGGLGFVIDVVADVYEVFYGEVFSSKL
jgi:hypothetical protein